MTKSASAVTCIHTKIISARWRALLKVLDDGSDTLIHQNHKKKRQKVISSGCRCPQPQMQEALSHCSACRGGSLENWALLILFSLHSKAQQVMERIWIRRLLSSSLAGSCRERDFVCVCQLSGSNEEPGWVHWQTETLFLLLLREAILYLRSDTSDGSSNH